MSSLISPAEARLRGIALPADDGAAQDVIDEQEAWLASQIGPLTGSRVETFYVAQTFTRGKLALRRYTDSVEVTDGGASFTGFRLVDHGSSIVPSELPLAPYWRGPYVTATYTPNDLKLVLRAIYGLVSIEAEPQQNIRQEVIGDYSRTVGAVSEPTQLRAGLVNSILPKRDQLLTVTPPYIFAQEGITRIP